MYGKTTTDRNGGKGAKRKKTDRDRKTKQRQTETEDQGAKCRKTDRYFKRRKREDMRHQSQNDRRDCNGQDMTNVLGKSLVETHEDKAQRRKINCKCMKRKRLFETREESAKCNKTI